MDNIKWARVGEDYHLRETSHDVDKLPTGVYTLVQNMATGELYLTRTQERFTFNYKIYGMEAKFIDRIVTTWKRTTGNLGILLNGTKGTGKTVTAELICGKLSQLPTILVPVPYGGLAGFLESVKQDVIVFFDEYEKIFRHNPDEPGENRHDMLSMMDGVANKEYRRLFLLTTNTTSVEPNLLERPSRIRYLKEFKDLPLAIITEIVDDLLAYKEHRKAVIKYIATLNIITVDIVKAVVQEVNIHNEPPAAFKELFNVTEKNPEYDVYKVEYDAEKGEEIEKYVKFSANYVEPMALVEKEGFDSDEEDGLDGLIDNHVLRVNGLGGHLGIIKKIERDVQSNGKLWVTVTTEQSVMKDNKHKTENRVYRIKEVQSYHYSFNKSEMDYY